MKELLFSAFTVAAIITAALAVEIYSAWIRKPKHWTQCAWCKSWVNEFGDTQTTTPPNIPCPISHGICPDCFGAQQQEIKRLTQ